MWGLGTIKINKKYMKEEYYFGYVSSISDESLNKDYHEVLVRIPGLGEDIKAFPRYSELDEPKVGDGVLLLCLDPVFKSYMIYEKIKDGNKFIGFRNSGKILDITDTRVVLGVFKEPENKDYAPDATWENLDQVAELEITDSGDINLESKNSGNINITTEGNIKISGSSKIEISGGNVDISGSSVKVSGSSVTPGSGPFCAIPQCLFTGAPHTGNTSA